MNILFRRARIQVLLCLLITSQALATGKFEPPEGKVLVFIGQDNGAVGGTPKYNQGYVDTMGVPAGITHYIYMVENKTNKYGFRFKQGRSEGLNQDDTWGAGRMCLRCYLESETLKGTMIALAISLEFGGELDMASGKSDHLIEELADFLNEFNDRAFLLRIGYEFEGPWNGYDNKAYAESFRRIVNGLRAKDVTNFATVMQSASGMLSASVWESYYPGDDYVDWVGFSYWSGSVRGNMGIMEFAEKHDKPVFIAESAARKNWTPKADGQKLWNKWFVKYFKQIEKHPRIKAISYINTDWESQKMWSIEEWSTNPFGRWGDTRLEVNPVLKTNWLEKMSEERYVHSPENIHQLIGFEPKK